MQKTAHARRHRRLCDQKSLAIDDVGGSILEHDIVAAALHNAGGGNHRQAGLLLQLLVPLPPGVVIAQGEEGRPQQGQRQQVLSFFVFAVARM